MNILTKRITECAAMMMIGDGALALVDARRHIDLWESGPQPWKAMMRPFVNRPGLTRLVGAAELATGVWLAQRQRSE